MEHSNLSDLITCLEYGTDIHIHVVFLHDAGNSKTRLTAAQTKHAKPFCDYMKSTPEGFRRCFRCRNIALRIAAEKKQSFGGFCCNGIYEYCHPVVEQGRTVAVIFLGNILPAGMAPPSEAAEYYINTFDRRFDRQMCRNVCMVLENHIRFLLREYAGQNTVFDPLVANIRSYIEESMYYDVTVAQIAGFFNYDEKYVGKVFKKHTGKTIKEYLNDRRIDKAVELLCRTNLPIAEIAARTGFNNVTYFNRQFKNHHGLTPGGYRSDARGAIHRND